MKAERLASGGAPRLLEVCSGCGGLSLGFARAGFDLRAHLEVDEEAARTYAMNFDKNGKRGHEWAKPRDIESASADDVIRDLGAQERTEDAFDVLVAGLPCQAFARIGRSKLRERAGGAVDAFRSDPRAGLYHTFLEYVNDTKPLAIVIENVPDILNFGGHNVVDDICTALEEFGYTPRYTLLNAAHYGVPQIRDRLFLVAYANVLEEIPAFPVPTNYWELPRGYEGSRRVALKLIKPTSHFVDLTSSDSQLPLAISTRDALDDLPVIREHLDHHAVIKRRRIHDMLPYEGAARHPYQVLMRTWPSFDASATNGHVVRMTDRDFPIFAAMPNGGDYPVARAVAEKLFDGALERLGFTHDDSGHELYVELRRAIIPPYDATKFPNKWWKLDPDRPSRTLTAHLGKDTYSHIHYDSTQARTISVREAARLQSFPDGFVFAGAMNSAFRQIGNAVPPLLSWAVADSVRSQLENSARRIEDARRLQIAC